MCVHATDTIAAETISSTWVLPAGTNPAPYFSKLEMLMVSRSLGAKEHGGKIGGLPTGPFINFNSHFIIFVFQTG